MKAAPFVLKKSMSLLLFFVVMIATGGLSAAQEKKTEKQPFDKNLLYQHSGKIEITYAIPRPAVIQDILKEYGFRFTGTVAPNFTADYTKAAKIALNLGARCTDGIMMVYGDKEGPDEDLKKLGETIMALIEDLGLRGKLKEIDTLKAALRTDDKEEIKKSIDMLFAETEIFLRQSDDADLAMLVSLGGWIELMYYASDELSRNYQPRSSKVLAMDYIADVYINALNKLKVFVQDSSLLLTISNQLPRVRQLMQNPGDEPLSKEAVDGIHSIAKNLKQEIEKQ